MTRCVSERLQIVGMSATLSNMDQLRQFLSIHLYTNHHYTKDFRPVSGEYMNKSLLTTSSWAIEFTAVSLLPAAAADGDITVTSLVSHWSTALVLSLLR